MKSKSFRFISLIGLFLWIAIGLKGCVLSDSAGLKPFQVGMNTWPGYQIMLYAQEAGLFEKHGLAVEFVRFSNQQDNIRATMRGSQDASFVPLAEVMQVDPTAEQPVFVLVVNVSHGSDGIAAQPGITSVKELKGKKVSAKLSTVSHLILLEALKANQLSPQDIEIIDVENERGIKLLKQGEVSAAVLWEPTLFDTAKAIGGKVIYTTADVDSIVIDGLTTRSSVMKTKQDELNRFIQVWFEVMDAVDANPQAVFSSVAKQAGGTPEGFAEDYKGLQKGDRAMNHRMFVEGRLQDIYQQTRQFLLEDPRHGRIVRADVEINAEPITKATQNWQP